MSADSTTNTTATATNVTALIDGRRLTQRRIVFFSIMLLLATVATWIMADILWRGGLTRTELFVFTLFVPLFLLVSFGFTQALAGFWMLWRGGDAVNITRTLKENDDAPLPVTAIAIPIYNEDVSQVYEGLRIMFRSLEALGKADRFDFFILSDSNDPNKWIEEEVSWVELCKQVKGFGRIFYRHRQIPINRKSGNISDFCRRWGSRYRYMVILDADSLMSGKALVSLVRLMETNPRAGIIQTAPELIRSKTLYGRLLQFASTLYGPVFLAGMNFWQGNEGNYWGHNAIIRLAPFIEHCALPDIPGQPSATAKFMSHDYVEAALMLRSGYEVWLAYDLPGSYEGGPPSLIENARRDRRWCKGNLQHAWLLFAKGIKHTSRLHLMLGIFSYVSSLLWFLLLTAGSYQCYQEWYILPRGYDYDVGLSRLLDIGGARLALALFLFTMSLLLAPKFFSWLLAARDAQRRRRFGGMFRLCSGCLIEQIFSMLVAPVQMLFHSFFVVAIWLGLKVGWGAQKRDASGVVDWGDAIRMHALHMFAGVIGGTIAHQIHPTLFWWMSPVFAGLVLAIPFSMLLGQTEPALALARVGLLTTPQEIGVPAEVAQLERNLSAIRERIPPPERLRSDYGFMQVLLDPLVNSVHVSLLRQRHKHRGEPGEYFRALEERVLRDGPSALNRREKTALLLHPVSMSRLHQKIWLLPDSQLSPWWTMAMRQYNILTSQPETALYR
jgi:membrane glycosyltransferase